MSDFNNQTVLITGAGSGIGAALAKYFAERSATLVVVDRNQRRLEETLSSLPGRGHRAWAGDVSDPQTASDAVKQALKISGSLEVLINSAGITILDKALDVRVEDFKKVLEVNLLGSFLMAQAAAKAMIPKNYGRIVNIASQAAVIGLDEHAAYCASKAGILGLSRVLSLEWGPKGITVNTVSPTVVETPMGRKVWAGKKGEDFKKLIPTRRFAQPEEVAGLIAYLASREAGMICGENVLIDGGYSTV